MAPSPTRVAFDAHAKLNLGLAVGPRRADGFHELVTFFQSVSLADTLIARRAARGFSLRVRFQPAALRGPRESGARSGIPRGGSNLVLRAARRVAQRAGLERGARFDLIKRIPAGAGLGGGSADAAAAIAALDALYRLRLGSSGRARIAAELGSDVPFAIRGGTALGRGRGGSLRYVQLNKSFRAVIAVPRWRVSTAQAYREIDRKKFGLTVWRAKLRFARKLAARRLKPEQALDLGNTFDRVLGTRVKEFDSLRARLRAAGLADVVLTGSGSAVFGLLKPGVPTSRVARRFTGSEWLYAVRSVRAGLRRVAVR